MSCNPGPREFTLSLILSLLCAVSLPGQEYVSALAGQGDGIYSLLRKFDLDKHSCNLDQFHKLNKLERNAFLVAGKRYLLPILIRKYNGRSIGSSIGVDDWETRVRIQDFNGRMLALNYRPTAFQEDKVLWVPYHELNCPVSDINIPAPALSIDDSGEQKEGVYPIFGKSYEKVPLNRTALLRGKVYYLVSGHGGPDPGAMGKFGGYRLCEDEYAYDVTLRLARQLIMDGAIVYLITRYKNDGIRPQKILRCDLDEKHWGDTPIHTDQKTRLTQRSDIINSLYAKNLSKGVPATNQQVIIIHVDSRSRNQRVDVFFYHQKTDNRSQLIAKKLMSTLKAKYRKYQPNRSYEGKLIYRDLFMIENCKPTTVYIELGNIQHPTDQQRILLENNRQAVATWLFEGLRNAP